MPIDEPVIRLSPVIRPRGAGLPPFTTLEKVDPCLLLCQPAKLEEGKGAVHQRRVDTACGTHGRAFRAPAACAPPRVPQ